MILEGKFIQKEGGRQVHNMYHCVPLDIFLAMVMIPFQFEKMVVHKKILKSRMTKFSLVDALLYKVTSYSAYYD